MQKRVQRKLRNLQRFWFCDVWENVFFNGLRNQKWWRVNLSRDLFLVCVWLCVEVNNCPTKRNHKKTDLIDGLFQKQMILARSRLGLVGTCTGNWSGSPGTDGILWDQPKLPNLYRQSDTRKNIRCMQVCPMPFFCRHAGPQNVSEPMWTIVRFYSFGVKKTII